MDANEIKSTPMICGSNTIKHLLLSLLKRWDFVLSGIAGILILANAYYFLLTRTTTLTAVIHNMGSEPIYLLLIGILVPVTMILFGLNFALSLILLRAGGGVGRIGETFTGAVLGAFGAGCPACGAFLFSLIGVSAGLAALPFGGLELWLGSTFIMALSFRSSIRRLDRQTCIPGVVEGSSPVAYWRLPNSNFSLIVALLLINLVGVTGFILMLNAEGLV